MNPYYQSQQMNPSQQQQQGIPPTRMLRPNMGTGSPNVAAAAQQSVQQQQQMGIYQQQHAGAIQFSPQQQQQLHGIAGQQHLQQQQPGLYNQPAQPQMMAPVTPVTQQPGSQQQMHTPMSNAPKTPATPQQQNLQQPHSIGPPTTSGQQPHSQQQPGSVQMQQPASIGASGINTPYSSLSTIPAPSSIGSITSTTSKPNTQQTAQQQQQIPTIETEFDPIATARMLILKDLRRSIVDLNSCADKIIEGLIKPSAGSSQTGGNITATGERQDEKKTTIGGPHSDHSIGPQSNLGFGPHSANPHSVNPHSVQNPLSVQNPQSVNPQSVSALPPGSVKSGDESGKKEQQMKLSHKEQYEMAKNNFMNVCDNIEKNLLLVLEVNKLQGKLYNQQSGLAVAWQPEQNASNLTLPQALQGFTTLMNADKQAIRANIADLNSLMEKLSDKTTKMEE